MAGPGLAARAGQDVSCHLLHHDGAARTSFGCRHLHHLRSCRFSSARAFHACLLLPRRGRRAVLALCRCDLGLFTATALLGRRATSVKSGAGPGARKDNYMSEHRIKPTAYGLVFMALVVLTVLTV